MISAEGAAKVRQCRKCHAEFSGERCKECLRRRSREQAKISPEKIKVARAKFYTLNKDRVNGYNEAWRAKNPERYKAISAKSKAKNRTEVLARAARYKDRLADAYVASLLGFRAEQVPKALIELKRAHLKIVRQLKEVK